MEEDRISLDGDLWFEMLEPQNGFPQAFNRIEEVLVTAAIQGQPDQGPTEPDGLLVERLREALGLVMAARVQAAFNAGWYLARGNIAGAEAASREAIENAEVASAECRSFWSSSQESGVEDPGGLHLV